ncbi:MAG: glycosyltransferase family 2 protein [Bacteroidales bacterium]|nr:glycosyltransferase family 2 protein [Bacteroidales bacterium]
MKPVSIIVPVYNGEQHIERCVRSLFEQSMDHIEFIFVDDCGNDGSMAIIQSLISQYIHREHDVKIIHHDHNKGIAGARNTGVDHATGEYIFFVDQDDYIDADAIETFYNKAKDENADLVYSNYLWQFANFATKYIFPPYVDKKDLIINALNISISPALWCKLYKKTLFTEHGIRFPENTQGSDDFVVVPMLYYHAKKIVQIHTFPYHYVFYNQGSLTKKGITTEWINQTRTSVQILENFFADKGQDYMDALEEYKVRANLFHILTASRRMQKQAFNTFPNVNYSRYYNRLSLLRKVIYHLAKRNLFFLLYLVLEFRRWGGIMKRNLRNIIKP